MSVFTRSCAAVGLMLCIFFQHAAIAATLVREEGKADTSPVTESKHLKITAPGVDRQLGILFSGDITSGAVSLVLRDSSGKDIWTEKQTEGQFQRSKIVEATSTSTAFDTELSVEQAQGEWSVIAVEMPSRSEMYPYLLTGPLMILVAILFVVGWWYRARVQLRWFWVGAGVWTVGVFLKFVVAILANKPVIASLEQALPHWLYIGVSSVYVGVLTGIFEIGVTLVAALIWKKVAANGERAVAIGVGAGAFEAILLGIAGFISVMAMFTKLPAMESSRIAAAFLAESTSIMWLTGVVERVSAILCHTSTRTLVLIAVATRRQSYFWYGFLLITALDTVAGWVHLGGHLGDFSLWWIELALAVFAVVSVPIVKWCLRNWPEPHSEPIVENPATTQPSVDA